MLPRTNWKKQSNKFKVLFVEFFYPFEWKTILKTVPLFLKPTIRIIMQCPENTTEWCRKDNRLLWMRRAIQNSSVPAKRCAYWTQHSLWWQWIKWPRQWDHSSTFVHRKSNFLKHVTYKMHTRPKNTAEGMSVITDGEASSVKSRQCAEYGTISPMNKWRNTVRKEH